MDGIRDVSVSVGGFGFGEAFFPAPFLVVIFGAAILDGRAAILDVGGAAILDIGGQSSRGHAGDRVSVAETPRPSKAVIVSLSRIDGIHRCA